MNAKELKSEKARIESKIAGLITIANDSEEAFMQVEFLKEELKWINLQLAK